MASRRASTIRPWLVEFILAEPTDRVHGQKLHILKYISGPHEDGSIVKEGTDRDVSIHVRFTRNAVDSFAASVESQSSDTHEEFNRAFILLRKYWIVHAPHEDKERTRFELVVDEFALWMNETGLRLKVVPLDCMEVQSVRERSNKLWEEWTFKLFLGMESETDGDDGDADATAAESSDDSIPLTQLLEAMHNTSPSRYDAEQPENGNRLHDEQSVRVAGPTPPNVQSQRHSLSRLRDDASLLGSGNKSPQLQLRLSKNEDKDVLVCLTPTDRKPIHGGVFTDELDLAEVDPNEIPVQFPATIDNTLFHIDDDQKQQLNSLSEWQPGYRPPLRSHSSTTQSTSSTNRYPILEESDALNGDVPHMSDSGTSTSDIPAVREARILQHPRSSRRFHGALGEGLSHVIGTITTIDLSCERHYDEMLPGTPGVVSCSVQVGDSLQEGVSLPPPSRKVHSRNSSAQVGDSLVNPLSSQSESQACVLEREIGFNRVTDSEPSVCMASRAAAMQMPHLDSVNAVMDDIRISDSETQEHIIPYDDLITDTHAQRMSSSREKSLELSGNSGVKGSDFTRCMSSYVRLLRTSPSQLRKLSGGKEDTLSNSGNVSNAFPVEDIGDYAQSVALSYIESPEADRTWSEPLVSADGGETNTTPVSLRVHSSLHMPQISPNKNIKTTSSTEGSVTLLDDLSLVQKSAHSQNGQDVTHISSRTRGRGRLSKENLMHDLSATGRNSRSWVSSSPNRREHDTSSSSSEPRHSPRRGRRRRTSKCLADDDDVSKDTMKRTDIRQLRNRSIENAVSNMHCKGISTSLGLLRNTTDTLKSSSDNNIQNNTHEGFNSSGSSTVSMYSSPLSQSHQIEKLGDNEDIIMPTPPKAKRGQFSKQLPSSTPSDNESLNTTTSNSNDDFPSSNGSKLSRKKDSRNTTHLVIAVNMFYKSPNRVIKSSGSDLLSPKVKTRATSKTSPADNLSSYSDAESSLVANSPSISNDSSSGTPAKVQKAAASKRLTKWRITDRPKVFTRCSKTRKCDSSRKSVPSHSTQVTPGDSPPSYFTLPILHLSPIHSREADVTELTAKTQSSDEEMDASQCEQSLQRGEVSPKAMESHATDNIAENVPRKLLLTENKRRATKDAQSSPIEVHQCEQPSVRKHRRGNMNKLDGNLPDVSRVVGGKSLQLVLDRIDNISVHSSSSDTLIYSTESAIDDSSLVKMRTGSSIRRSSRRYSCSSSDNASNSGLSKLDSTVSSVTSVDTQSDASVPIKRTMRISSKHPVTPKRRSQRMHDQCKIPKDDTNNISSDSTSFLESKDTEEGHTEDSQSMEQGSKNMASNNIMLVSSVRTRKHRRENDKTTDQVNSEQDSEDISHLPNSTPNQKLKPVEKTRRKKGIEINQSDVAVIDNSIEQDIEEEFLPMKRPPSTSVRRTSRKCRQIRIGEATNENATDDSVNEYSSSPSCKKTTRRGKIKKNNKSPYRLGTHVFEDTGKDSEENAVSEAQPSKPVRKRSKQRKEAASDTDESGETHSTPDKTSTQDLSKPVHQRLHEGKKKKNEEDFIENGARSLRSKSRVRDKTLKRGKAAKSKMSALSGSTKGHTLHESDETTIAEGSNANTNNSKVSPLGNNNKQGETSGECDIGECDSDEEYQPSPKVRNILFLSRKTTRRNKDRSQLSLRKKAPKVKGVITKKKKMNIQLSGSGKMEVLSKKATDVNMILGVGSFATKGQTIGKAKAFAARKRKLYSDRIMFGDPTLDTQEKNSTSGNSMPPLFPKNLLKSKPFGANHNNNNENSKLQKVPQRITKIVGLLSFRAEQTPETRDSSSPSHQPVVSAKRMECEKSSSSSFEVLENSPSQLTPSEGGHQFSSRSPLNSLPSHQPEPRLKQVTPAKDQSEPSLEEVMPTADNSMASEGAKKSSRHSATLQQGNEAAGWCPSLQTPVSSLPSHQPQSPNEGLLLGSDRCSAFGVMEKLLKKTLSPQKDSSQSEKPFFKTPVKSLPTLQLEPEQPTSNTKVSFQMEDVKAILATLPAADLGVLISAELPDDLAAHVRDYFRGLDCATSVPRLHTASNVQFA